MCLSYLVALMLESKFRAKVVKKLYATFPGCLILLNDATQLQGIPDLVIFHGDRWGMLEFKASSTSAHQPNQDYYVQMLGEMSFAEFIYPENEEEILRGLQRALEPNREACGSKRQ